MNAKRSPLHCLWICPLIVLWVISGVIAILMYVPLRLLADELKRDLDWWLNSIDWIEEKFPDWWR